MMNLKPTELAAAVGIGVPYASQILSGTRTNVSTKIALAAFRAFGVRLGLLAEMNDDDIAKLVMQQLTPDEAAICHGGDAADTVDASFLPDHATNNADDNKTHNT